MASRKVLLRFMILAVGLLVLAPLAHAQLATASLRGKVTDEQGGVVPGATVTAREVDTNTVRSVVTGEAGQYFIPNLPSGTYELSAELTGFTTDRRSGLELRIGQEFTIDLVLRVGAVEETVTVITEAPVLETTKNTLSSIIRNVEIDDLPTVERDFTDLALLAPGVTVDSYAGGSSITVNGQRGFANAFFIDGATNEWQYYGQQASTIPQDWIQEFQVMTNSFPAEFGTASGGVLNAITRSGTNNWQARVYSFFRDDSLDAPPFAGFFENGDPQFLDSPPPLEQQRVGGFLGGPIVRDKAFFFVGLETLNRDSSEVLGITDFWRNQGTESVIPTGTNDVPILLKFDYNISDKNRIFARFDRTEREMMNYSLFGSPIDTLEDRLTFGGPAWNIVTQWTSVLSNDSFNEVRFFFGSNKPPLICNKSGTGGSEHLDLGPPGTFAHIRYPGAWFGCPIFTGLEGEENIQIIENFSTVRGNHQLKFGAEAAQVRTIIDIANFHDGFWRHSNDIPFDINNPDSYPTRFVGNVGSIDEKLNTWNFYGYLQDTWQVRNNVTLNLGIRYDLDRTILVGNQYVDDKNARLAAKFGGGQALQKTNSDTNNFAPRFGITWAPTEDQRTLIRGAAGIYYDQNHNNFNAIYLVNTLLAEQFIVFDAFSPFENPFYDPNDPDGSAAQLRAFLAQNYPFFPDLSLAPLTKETIDRIDPDFQIPKTIQLTAGIAHDFGGGFSMEADYVHSRGEEIPLGIDDNVEMVNGEVRQIDDRFASVFTFSNLGWSRYHALQTSADYASNKGRVGISYTLSKVTSNTDTIIYGGTATNPFDLSEDEGPDGNDRRHNMVIHGAYLFPLDIQFAGILTVRSALPYSVYTAFQLDDDPFEDRPEPRNSRREDSFRSLDLRLSKLINIGGNTRLTLFWEMFNATNRTNFGSFEGNLESDNFGQPLSANEMRRQQFGFRIDFF